MYQLIVIDSKAISCTKCLTVIPCLKIFHQNLLVLYLFLIFVLAVELISDDIYYLFDVVILFFDGLADGLEEIFSFEVVEVKEILLG